MNSPAESEMDKISRLINKYLDLDYSGLTTHERDRQHNLGSLCQEIKWRLGREMDLWHRLMNHHVDRFHHLGDLETKARERKQGKST